MVAAPALAAAAPLLSLLDDPEVTDVLVNGADGVWIDGPRGLRRAAVSLGGPAALRALACSLAALGGARLDDASPAADARLPGSIRLHAVLPPVAPAGPLICLRAVRREAFTLPQLVDRGTVPPAWAAVVEALIAGRANFLVSGATGAGKTTLLAALLGHVPADQRIVCIEEAAEITTTHPHCVRLEARRANTEGRGEFALSELVRHALRMRPDRIVLGECRGAEVRDVLTALNTGHEGSAATIHANAPRDVPARLAALGSLAGLDRQSVAAQAASALQAVFHVERHRTTGHRRLVQIAAVEPHGDAIAVVPALVWGPDGPSRAAGWERLGPWCGP